jgi:hypothetical protein
LLKHYRIQRRSALQKPNAKLMADSSSAFQMVKQD